MTDANWGPQDQSTSKHASTVPLDLFKSRSISGYLLWFNGPLHWVSKRQTITARSTAEAEIYATDECVKSLIHLDMLVSGLGLQQHIMPRPILVLNDNAACVSWSRNTTTKGLRHVQVRENAVRESVQSDFVRIEHVAGKLNLADLFTKEHKDDNHFLTLCDQILSPP